MPCPTAELVASEARARAALRFEEAALSSRQGAEAKAATLFRIALAGGDVFAAYAALDPIVRHRVAEAAADQADAEGEVRARDLLLALV